MIRARRTLEVTTADGTPMSRVQRNDSPEGVVTARRRSPPAIARGVAGVRSEFRDVQRHNYNCINILTGFRCFVACRHSG
jgi:hypothetical protein